ncbi:unnamed protein product [Taenia asiatica]|uniref:SH2 domain-containing protein n=1 Tax=Taenia asiatica TaxID=60517 RepID=A0A0R3WBX3_TAEAS|nr:unnamed protein product [Taenia asiatica]
MPVFVKLVQSGFGRQTSGFLHALTTSVEDDPNWYLAEQDGRKGLVPCNYISFRPNPWYMQACPRNTAEECLLETDPCTGLPVQPDGAFVVRRSESNGPGFSLSVK